MQLLCPGCKSPIDPAAASCPLCLRPRTRQEILAGYNIIKAGDAARRRRPLVIVVCLLAVGALVYGARRASETGRLDPAKAQRLLSHAKDDLLDFLHFLAGRFDRVDLGPAVQPVRVGSPKPPPPGKAYAEREAPVSAPPTQAPEAAPPDAFPGSKYLAEQSAAYSRENEVPKAWIYRVRASFEEVVEFYRKQLSSKIVSESEGEEGYIAMTADLQVRIARGTKGLVLVLVETYRSKVILQDKDARAAQGVVPSGPEPGMPQTPRTPSSTDRKGGKDWCHPFCM